MLCIGKIQAWFWRNSVVSYPSMIQSWECMSERNNRTKQMEVLVVQLMTTLVVKDNFFFETRWKINFKTPQADDCTLIFFLSSGNTKDELSQNIRRTQRNKDLFFLLGVSWVCMWGGEGLFKKVVDHLQTPTLISLTIDNLSCIALFFLIYMQCFKLLLHWSTPQITPLLACSSVDHPMLPWIKLEWNIYFHRQK